jgi:hypothetical protein
MDCGTFRENHGALIDEAVCDADLVAMQRHVSECAACAAHDTAVRRALLLFRNMPTIEPSSDFSVRLHARLRDVRAERRPTVRAPYRGPGVAAFAGLAAAVIAAGYLTVSASTWTPPVGPVAMAPVLAPVVAIAPATDPNDGPSIAPASDSVDLGAESDADAMSALTSPAFIASVSAGSPVWSATVLAARAPARLAAVQLKLTSLGR